MEKTVDTGTLDKLLFCRKLGLPGPPQFSSSTCPGKECSRISVAPIVSVHRTSFLVSNHKYKSLEGNI